MHTWFTVTVLKAWISVFAYFIIKSAKITFAFTNNKVFSGQPAYAAIMFSIHFFLIYTFTEHNLNMKGTPPVFPIWLISKLFVLHKLKINSYRSKKISSHFNSKPHPSYMYSKQLIFGKTNKHGLSETLHVFLIWTVISSANLEYHPSYSF